MQRYMAQWVAKLAAVEKDYADSARQMEEASKVEGRSDAEILAEGGSWYLEAVDLIQQAAPESGEQQFSKIREQLADLNSDK